VSGGAWREKIIKGFTGIGTSIVNPNPVVLDASGNVYGTSLFGGLQVCNDDLETCGTIYELTPASTGAWTLTGLYAFRDNSNGFFPYAGLTIDSAGNIYGTTGAGGDMSCGSTGGCGVVFRIVP